MISISGMMADGFEAVADAFRRNFDDPGEDAGAVAVFHQGRKVVDVRAGTDVVNCRAMPADALMVVASCSKGVTATVLSMLVEQGLVDPDERVGTYWPEFATAGKENATVAMVAAHTVGLPYPPVGTGLRGLDVHRGEAVTEALAAARPLWPPGTAMAHHPITYGTLLNEIVRRATGVSIAGHVQAASLVPCTSTCGWACPSSTSTG
jgi:CubicO group peptidase (beta-lactamase class C family)